VSGQPLSSGERDRGAHWIGGFVHIRADMEAAAMIKIPSHCWESNRFRPASSPVTIYCVAMKFPE
jgi:hypothetical protein